MPRGGWVGASGRGSKRWSAVERLRRAGARACPRVSTEPLERRVLLSSVQFFPQKPDGSLDVPVTFQSNAAQAGSVQDFAPLQTALLHDGFAAPLDDLFLKIDGIPGESQDKGHGGAIDLSAVSFGADTKEVTSDSGTGGAGAGKVESQFLALHAVSRVSAASPRIEGAALSGQHLPRAELMVRRSGATQDEFLNLVVEDAVVGSYEVQSAPDGALLEEFTLDFTKATITYTPQKADGTPGTPVTFPANALGAQDFAPAQVSLLDDFQKAQDALFLTLDSITGDVQDKAHDGAIAVSSFGWGADATPSLPTGGGAGVGKSQFFELHFVTPVSAASPKLLEAATTGRRLANATFAARRPGGQFDYYKVNAQDVTVSSDRVTTAADGTPLEEFTLGFAGVSVSYSPQQGDGTPGAPVSFSVGNVQGGVLPFAPPQPSLLDGPNSSPKQDLFLKVDGIPGEAHDKAHDGEIDVLAASWGVDEVGSTATGGGGGLGRPAFQELHVATLASAASPKLIDAIATGRHIRDLTLTFRRRGATPFEFLTQHLEDVVVSSYRLANAGGGAAVEEFTFAFAKSTLAYTPQNNDGTPGEPVSFTADLALDGGKIDEFAPPQTSLVQGRLAPAIDDVFVKVQGVAGESRRKGHEDEIEALGYEWGADLIGAASSTSGAGGGAGVGKSEFQEFHFLAEVSKASPLLLQAVATGKHIPSVDVTLRRPSSESAFDFIKVHLEDVRVSSQQLTTAATGTPLEEYTLNFVKASYTYTPQLPTGLPGMPVVFQGNVESSDTFTAREQSLLHANPVVPPLDDLFLQIDGIPGSSQDKAHAGEVELSAFSFGADTAGGSFGGTGGGLGKTTFESFHALAHVSQASPKLMEAAATGKHIKFVELTARKAGASQVEFLTLKLENAVVGSYEVRPDPAGGLLEEFTLAYTKVTYTYVPQNGDGTPGAPVVFTQDLLKTGGGLGAFIPAQTSLLDEFADADSKDPLFLDIDGITGDAQDKGHVGEIAAESFSWGLFTPPSVGGTGAGVSKTQFFELHVVAPVSSATPQILQGLLTDRHYATADLTVRRTGGTQQEYYKVHLSDVQISAHELTTAPDGRLLEEFTLRFRDSNGGGGGGGGLPGEGDDVPPTVAIEPVDPDPRTTPVDSIEIDFSERVGGFDLSDLALTRDGGANLLTAAQTLTTPDDVHWLLGNLAGLTGSHGTYVLTLTAQGSGITDLVGNPLATGATEQWVFSNRPPSANDDVATTLEDSAVVIPVLANDTDADGDPLTVASFTNPAHGTVAQNADGSLQYTPAANYNGPDGFTYAISDGQGGTATATVSITVVPVNDKPTATPLSVTVAEDGSVTFQLGGTDVETAPQDLTVTIQSLPARGQLRLAATGQPAAVGQRVPGGTAFTIAGRSRCDDLGADGFRFTVTDTGDPAGTRGNALTSDPAPVSINFLPAVQDGQIVLGSDGVLRVGGTAGADDISTILGLGLRVRFGTTGATRIVPLLNVKEIRVWGRAGNDDIRLDTALVPVFVSAGAGDDDVSGGFRDDVIDGGAGRDNLEGGLGDDFLIGAAGADRLIGAPGNDILVGGHVDCDVTLGSLRQILAQWADRHIADPNLPGKASDTEEDRLTGAAGADWFIVSAADKITGNPKEKQGDLESLIK